jgi:hypothetical protein
MDKMFREIEDENKQIEDMWLHIDGDDAQLQVLTEQP